MNYFIYWQLLKHKGKEWIFMNMWIFSPFYLRLSFRVINANCPGRCFKMYFYTFLNKFTMDISIHSGRKIKQRMISIIYLYIFLFSFYCFSSSLRVELFIHGALIIFIPPPTIPSYTHFLHPPNLTSFLKKKASKQI